MAGSVVVAGVVLVELVLPAKEMVHRLMKEVGLVVLEFPHPSLELQHFALVVAVEEMKEPPMWQLVATEVAVVAMAP